MPWYSNCYRRNLCDMHIEDWDDSFLREFSPEEYVENLKRAKINDAMLYLQSHVGLCYWPTESGVMHKALRGREDLIRRVEETCHAEGIYVTGYYSLIYNCREHDRHPEWRMTDARGGSRRERGIGEGASTAAFSTAAAARYGLVCPNNLEYRAFVREQVREMLKYFRLDAIFFDMPFWQSEPCTCPACRERWAKEVGGPFPEAPDPANPIFPVLRTKQYAWMGEFCRFVTECVKSIDPDMPVEYNYAGAIAGCVGTGEEVSDAGDFTGGDLYGGLREASFACKFYRSCTKNRPFEYMASRCKPRLSMHTLTKTPDELRTIFDIIAANHGAALIIDAIDPVGTQDRRVYERVGEAFGDTIPFEPYYVGDPVEKVGIYYGIRSQYDPSGENHTAKTAAVGMGKLFTGKHVPYGVTGAFDDVFRFPVLTAPCLRETEEKDFGRLEEYVRRGGRLYFSGDGCKKLAEQVLGLRFTGRTEHKQAYFAPTPAAGDLFDWFNPKYPLPWEGTVPTVTAPADAEVLATLTLPYTTGTELRFASIHSDPPGPATDVPVLVRRKYGEGEAVWCAAPLEESEYPELQNVIWGLIKGLWGNSPLGFETDAPADTELTAYADEKGLILHAVNLADLPTVPDTAAFRLRVRAGFPVKRVTLLPEEKEIPFEKTEDGAAFTVPAHHIHTALRIEKA